jgi:hypothetical protein
MRRIVQVITLWTSLTKCWTTICIRWQASHHTDLILPKQALKGGADK